MQKTGDGVATLYPFPRYEVTGGTVTKYYLFNGQRIAMCSGNGILGRVQLYHPHIHTFGRFPHATYVRHQYTWVVALLVTLLVSRSSAGQGILSPPV